jgi:hypothetical protein
VIRAAECERKNAAGRGELHGRQLEVQCLFPSQVFFELAPGVPQLFLALSELLLAVGDLFHVLADLSPVASDFFAAGAVTDVPAQFGSVSSQLLRVLVQLTPVFPNFSSGFPDILQVFVDFPSVRTAKLPVVSITPVLMLIAPIASSVIRTPPPRVAIAIVVLAVQFFVMAFLPAVMLFLPTLVLAGILPMVILVRSGGKRRQYQRRA